MEKAVVTASMQSHMAKVKEIWTKLIHTFACPLRNSCLSINLLLFDRADEEADTASPHFFIILQEMVSRPGRSAINTGGSLAYTKILTQRQDPLRVKKKKVPS